MNQEIVKEIELALGNAFTAMNFGEYILQPKTIEVGNFKLTILAPFFQGSWRTWGDKEKFISTAKDLGIEIKTFLCHYSTHSFTIEDTTTTLMYMGPNIQFITLETFGCKLCITIDKRNKIELDLYHLDDEQERREHREQLVLKEKRYYLTDIYKGGTYELKDIGEFECNKRRIDLLKQLIPQLLSL